MALTSLAEHIADTQLGHGARGYISPFIFPQQRTLPVPLSDLDDANARKLGMTPEKLRELRLFFQKTNKECEERLAAEMVAFFALNAERTRATYVGYVSKGEAGKVVRGIVRGELLDLDPHYAGIFVRANHLFISESKLVDGIHRYPNIDVWDVISRLIAERASERNAA